MSIFKDIRRQKMITSIMIILIGIILCIHPGGAVSAVVILAGVFLFGSGVYDIIGFLFSRDSGLFLGIVKCLLGMYVFSHTGSVVSLFTTIFGIFLLCDGFVRMKAALLEYRSGVCGIGRLILPVVILLAAVFIIINPFTSVTTALVWLGIFLIGDGICGLIAAYHMKEAEKRTKDFFHSFTGSMGDDYQDQR